MTPRRVLEEAGGFPRLGRLYYHHDGIYSERVVSKGYRTGVLAGVKVYHACDRAASEMFRIRRRSGAEGGPSAVPGGRSSRPGMAVCRSGRGLPKVPLTGSGIPPSRGPAWPTLS